MKTKKEKEERTKKAQEEGRLKAPLCHGAGLGVGLAQLTITIMLFFIFEETVAAIPTQRGEFLRIWWSLWLR